jgi:hypothetical protein
MPQGYFLWHENTIWIYVWKWKIWMRCEYEGNDPDDPEYWEWEEDEKKDGEKKDGEKKDGEKIDGEWILVD